MAQEAAKPASSNEDLYAQWQDLLQRTFEGPPSCSEQIATLRQERDDLRQALDDAVKDDCAYEQPADSDCECRVHLIRRAVLTHVVTAKELRQA